MYSLVMRSKLISLAFITIVLLIPAENGFEERMSHRL